MSRQTLSETYQEILLNEGYRPRIDSDGDVVFKHEGGNYYISVDERDRKFFRLVFPNFYQADNDEERKRVEQICLEVTRRVKVAKVVMRNNTVSATIEMLITAPENITGMLGRMMKILQDAVEMFRSKLLRNSGDEANSEANSPAPGRSRGLGGLLDVLSSIGRIDLNAPLAVSGDGEQFAISTADHEILVCDGSSAAVLQRLRGHDRTIRCLAISADGRRLASVSDDRSVRIWDLREGKQQHLLRGHSDWVRGVAFAPDSRTVASAADDKTVRLWDAVDGRELHVMHGHSDWPRYVVFSADGRLLVSGGDDSTVRVWQVSDGRLLQELEGLEKRVLALDYSADGRYLAASAADGAVRVWRSRDWGLQGVVQAHSDWVRDIRFSPDGELLASAADDRKVLLMRTDTLQIVHSLQGHQRWVRGVAFTGSGDRLASAGDDGQLIVWDVASGNKLQEYEEAGRTIGAVRIVGDRLYSRSSQAGCTRRLSGDTQPAWVEAALIRERRGDDDASDMLDRLLDRR